MHNKRLLGLLVSTAATLLAACGDDATTADGGSDTGGTGDTTTTDDPTITPTTDPDGSTSGPMGSTSSGVDSTGMDSTDTGPMAMCGDGVLDPDEMCDDGNAADGDGCSATCEPETGFACDDAEPTVCTGICGDGMVVGAEECDDSNANADDGCDPTCVVEPGWSCGEEPSVCMTGCGDGIVAGMEECDDGALDPGDGCAARCTIEPGYECIGEPSACAELCGDGLVIGIEECDDGSVVDGDGCSSSCTQEAGWYCIDEPSDCVTACGDGVVAGAEICDAGDIAWGDGCNPFCEPEFAWTCDGLSPTGCTLTETLESFTLGDSGGCVLTNLGNVGCFGDNVSGDVGNGTVGVETHLPQFALDGVTAVTAGGDHKCAIRAGEVWCWGDNPDSQLGPLSMPPMDESTPIQVTGLPVAFQIEAGFDHTCVIDNVGTVWCWGDNDNRQLGQGAITTDNPNPTAVPMPGGLAAIELGLGENHSCAVLGNNTVACWGDDDNGQLGDGASGTDSGDPAVVPGLTGIVEVAAGDDHTCARDSLGAVWCWGENIDGGLGDGLTTDSPNPIPVALPAPADKLALGFEFTCALLTDDEVYCWGEGSDYQIGNGGDYSDVLTPAPVINLPPGDIVHIDAGSFTVCVMTSTGVRACWGEGEEGQLGIAPLNQLDLTPPLVFSGPLADLELSKFEYRGQSCGALTNGTLECAGAGDTVGTTTLAAGLWGPMTYHLSELTPITSVTDVQEVGLGNGFMCVRTTTNVQCWGDNANLNLGTGLASTTDILTPTTVVGLGAVDELEVGEQFACVRTGGTVSCWGDNVNKACGDDSTTADKSSPFTVPLIADAVDIDAGEDFACALRATGAISCWGDDGVNQLGDNDGNTTDSGNPVDVTGLPGAASSFTLGFDHGCAIVAGEVYCWGLADRGQLGQGNTTNSDTALLVPGLPPNITQVSAGGNFTCAVSDVGEAWCWGYGLDGQLGDGGGELTGLTDYLSPVLFQAAGGITAMENGNSFTCIDNGAGWQCVGFTSAGQLAHGSVEPAYPLPALFGL